MQLHVNRVIIGLQLRTVLTKYVNTDFAFCIAAGARGGRGTTLGTIIIVFVLLLLVCSHPVTLLENYVFLVCSHPVSLLEYTYILHAV